MEIRRSIKLFGRHVFDLDNGVPIKIKHFSSLERSTVDSDHPENGAHLREQLTVHRSLLNLILNRLKIGNTRLKRAGLAAVNIRTIRSP